MNNANPYLPPVAAVADVAEDEAGTQAIQLFSWRGRIGRVRFIAYSVWGYLLCVLGAFLTSFIVGALGFPRTAAFIGLAALLPYLVFIGFISVQRSHDMGWNGWTTLLMIIPFVPLIWMIKAGTTGRNAYGLPPPPNSLSVKIGAWMMLVLVVLGIAAAAVAVTTYQSIAERAKAST